MCILEYAIDYTSHAAQHRVHWTAGIRRHFQAFCWLQVFSTPEHCPRPPRRQLRQPLGGSQLNKKDN
jgi:hypothetical protein